MTALPPPASFQNSELLANEITRLAGHINAANYRFLTLIAEFDRRGGWQGTGIKSCAHWLGWKCGLALGAAREKVRVARCLDQLPLIKAAFERGELSYSMVRALTRAATDVTEDYYLQIAEHGTASHVERLIRAHRRVKKLQGKNRETCQYEARELSCYPDDDGMWVVKARLPAEAGQHLVKAINAIMDGEQDESPAHGVAETHRAAKPGGPGGIPAKTFPQKRADALIAMTEHYLASPENRTATLTGSERTQVMLHVDLQTLQRARGDKHPQHCRLERDQWLHPDTARRLSCDASLVTVLTGEAGKVLNIGRRSRIVPPHIRRALELRDEGCRFPGCDCNRTVDAHHIRHWADGGETRLDNLVTLCRFHHRALHRGEFSVQLAENGDFRFTQKNVETLLPSCRPLYGRSDECQEDVPAGTSAQVLDIETFRPDVSAGTCQSRWCGETMDYDMAVQGLMRREERSAGASGTAP